ncbi:hypothetical protein AMJ39_04195 [candidate division TA06 bacterium DG_24]|uniref:DUF4046 domain-containing protein n=3 Tax=Bacteria division TA06 TaxID=1156500 RepID=A0A0S8JNG6_UNCT6|nr:MAG: hypothetical protein AMJ39_04195 [candidate division TA06 bacterium DG_24]KPK70557.1 MAG: hypothetical protein AMJ82_02835 [candidate division TA06 bacterium SM23_40]KPL10364.1 MAG: hypothetical protein AMJ71_03260 [candidate division TA06 bacterium SM1_40]
MRGGINSHQEVVAMYEKVLAGEERRFPNKFFDGQDGKKRARIVTRYLFDQKLKIPPDQIPVRMHKKLFYENGLAWMLGKCFGWSPYKAIENAYPGYYKPWQFNVKGIWRGARGLELAAEATRWMVKMENVGAEEVPREVTPEIFAKYDLSGMLSMCFHGSCYRAIENAYPGRYQPWEFKNVPKHFWSGEQGMENARAATRWLVEEVLNIPRERVFSEMTYELFRRHGLGGMLTRCFGGSSKAALRWAYPDLGVRQPGTARSEQKEDADRKAIAWQRHHAPAS